jgi:ATP-dependent helicase/DNAse subunit B
MRAALRGDDAGVRLLVPTATLAQHLQNALAREGFVLRRGAIQTLSGFVRELTPELTEATDPVLHLIVEEAAKKVARPEFARVVTLPGFCTSLKRVIDEFASAGCDSERLATALPDAPLAHAFLAVYREADRDLARRGLVTRAGRLARAKERVSASGVRSVWLDGFHVLTEPELRLIEELGQTAEITLAMGDEDLTEAMRAWLFVMGFEEERAVGYRATSVRALVKAPSIEREVEEIARRILDQASAGRPFREMGVIVRAPELYEPLLRTTFERFGIPARFYFDAELARHAAVRFLSGTLDAMWAGWDHQQTLAALRLAPRFADSYAMDRFDFAVRTQTPNTGLAAMKTLLLDESGVLFSWAESIARRLDALAVLEEWRGLEIASKDWAARFHTLRNLFRPAGPRPNAGHEVALEWRGQAAALDAFDEAVDEAAIALPGGRAVRFEAWWRTVKSVLRLKPLRVPDGRRNVVHVLSAHEARQWVLPVVFVCGMVEKQFPRFQQQDPFFPESARVRLNESGIRVRTAAEFDREERALFESAITRATLLTTLSYPEFDARGERNLPSLYLEDLLLASESVRPVRLSPRRELGPQSDVVISDPVLLQWLRADRASFSATSLESYLQCPYQYFATKTLRLRTAPDRPEDRLNFLKQGEIVHEVLAEWWASPEQDIASIFERVFARYLSEEHIPPGYHTERLRNSMLDDLTRFARQDPWPRAAFRSEMEKEFTFELAPGIAVRGRIDRIDTAPDGKAYVIDYKYSRADSVKDKLENDNLLQAPLYLIAAEQVYGARAAGVFYVGLRTGMVYAGWSESPLLESVGIPERWLEQTRERALGIVEEIRQGKVSIQPADPDKCRWCDVKDVCRVDQTATEELVQVEEAE